ncbi:MAG: hypothetical protein IT367_09470 [Candidatus Hydrogenedentes bacterium]|nr:hypothetical protein [Candidatus Hydrogenedentota bacterium]
MAIRRHLLLVAQSDRDKIAAAIASTPFVPMEVAGPWCWTLASALSESHENLRDVALKANVPFLLFTTFDGDGWHVSANDCECNVTEATHVFEKDWAEGNKGATKRVGNLIALIASVATTADAKALEDTLSGRAVTNAESDSDLGDLPRLLHLLGAVGIVDIPQNAPARRERPNQPTRTLTLLKGHADRARSAVSGVSVPVAHAGDLAALALYCDPDALLSLIADGPDLPEISLDIPCKISKKGEAVYVEADGGIGLKANVIRRSVEQLAAAAGLEELTIVSGRSRGGKDVGWHRYAGRVANGIWEMEEATPAVDSAQLCAALELIAQLRSTSPIVCESESEATVVAKRCEKSLYLDPNLSPKPQGASLAVQKDARFYVIMEIFRTRFAKTWDASAAQKAEEVEQRKWDRLEESLVRAAEAYGLRDAK